MNETGFKSLSLSNWRQFSQVDFEVHPRVTIITGSNGSGKSSILNIFTQHFGFSRPYLGTPKKSKDGSFVYDSGLRRRVPDYQRDGAFSDLLGGGYHESFYSDKLGAVNRRSPYAFEVGYGSNMDDDAEEEIAPQGTGEFVKLGTIIYTNDVSTEMGLPDQRMQSYGVSILNQQAVSGVHIASHRALTNYQPIAQINLLPMRAAQAYSLYNQEVLNRYSGGYTTYSPIYRMKEALIAMAAFGEGNSFLQADAEVLSTFTGFIEVLRLVLPEEIGFRSIAIRIPDVVLQTKSGDFLLDSSSGGVNAIIEMVWQIYLYSVFIKDQKQEFFVVTIDEPENHLHPSMQRAILPNLLAAFPNAQFIVATHSPFVVSAVEDSSVYVLNYNGNMPSSFDVQNLPDRRRVTSLKLDSIHKGGSASEILREVLGVPVTTPKWVQDKVDKVILEFEGQPISNALLNTLRKRLADEGFGELYPDALSKVVEAADQTND